MTQVHRIGGRRIDITVRPETPRLLSGAAIARAVAAALDAGGAPVPASLSVVLSDDVELAELNETHLGHEGPTDVLSFPLLSPAAFPRHEGQIAAGGPGRPTRTGGTGKGASFVLPPQVRPQLGDIVVSVERAIAQASDGHGGQTGDRRWAPGDELRLLVTHGALHICGWDHAEPAEGAAMRALERRLLGDPPA